MVFRFTIDNLTNRYVPYSRIDRLPKPLRRILGSHSPPPVADYWIWLEVLVSTFCGVALLEGVFKSHTVFTAHHGPIIIASYGATAILCFNAHSVPLAQPRNILVGHFVSALIGVCFQKLFLLSESARDHYWASGALSVGVASVAMSLLNCVHPPAGASALLPSIDLQIQKMSWWFLPVQLVLSVLIICVAMITGNVIRRFPTYWWTPANLKPQPPDSETSPEEDKSPVLKSDIIYADNIDYVKITADKVVLPSNFDVEDLNLLWLEQVRQMLADASGNRQQE